MADERCRCCKTCCYSTPYGSIFALSVTLVGLVGFLSSSVYSVILVSNTSFLSNYTIILGPIVGGVAGTTGLPLLIATIMAYCVTGYVKDEMYHPLVKKCVGGACNILVIGIVFFYFILWVLMTVALSLITSLYFELEWACQSPSDPAETGCFTYNNINTNVTFQVCAPKFDEFCTQGIKIGLSLVISLGFSLVILFGLVGVIIVQAGNYISARESSKRSYRPGAGGNY